MEFDLRRANHADGFARTRDGINIRFLLHGDDGDETRRAVLIHSLAMDATFWLPVIEKPATLRSSSASAEAMVNRTSRPGPTRSSCSPMTSPM